MKAQQAPISVTMALDALDDTVALMGTLKAEHALIQAQRDDMIRDLLDAGMKYRAILRITSLGRDRIYAIKNSPSKTQELTIALAALKA